MAHRCRIAVLVSATVFLSLALFVGFTGIPPWERALYEALTRITVDVRTIFHWITRLGGGSFLIPVSILLIFALPDQLLRRWWLWVAVMLVCSSLESFSKSLVGRPRPESLRPGFPSAHTAAAAAFFTMAAYLAGKTLRSAGARVTIWMVAALTILSVALSRIALQVHWPLDTVGGAALGALCLAAAAWWNEQHPVAAAPPRPGRAWPSFQTWVYRWRETIPIPFYSVLFFTPPMVGEHSALDLVFDIVGVLVIVTALVLRAWASGTLRGAATNKCQGEGLVTTGPFRLMRHPVYAGNFLVGVGIVVMAESGLGLVIIPAVFFGANRLIVRFEEGNLRHRFGEAYDEYCRQVPRWLPRRLSTGSASPRAFAWSALKDERPAVLVAAALAVLAEVSEVVPPVFG